ncbi:MAG TPA: hypothetical protein VKV26_08895 [Dehalococcoidia bacterium]|nr:hypothetical protein [Dehalococcoidia bacterium]
MRDVDRRLLRLELRVLPPQRRVFVIEPDEPWPAGAGERDLVIRLPDWLTPHVADRR